MITFYEHVNETSGINRYPRLILEKLCLYLSIDIASPGKVFFTSVNIQFSNKIRFS